MRHYAGEEDYSRLQQLLRDTLVANGLRERSWHVARLEYYRWHGILNCGNPGFEFIRIWEADSKIIAFLNLEGRLNAFVNVHPDWQSPELWDEMLAVAEADLSGTGADGREKLYVWANSSDMIAHGVLKKRGYALYDEPEAACTQGRQDPDREIPRSKLPTGYSVRAQTQEGDLPKRSWCSWRAFHPEEPDEKYEGWEWYRSIQAAPLYRQDLDFVAVAPDGDIVSFTTVWYDEATRTAYFEPVGTHPDHQRRGLAMACINEGLRRVKKLGCRMAFLGGHSEAAQALYDRAGFCEFEMLEPWVKFL